MVQELKIDIYHSYELNLKEAFDGIMLGHSVKRKRERVFGSRFHFWF